MPVPRRVVVGLDAAPPPPLQFGPPGTPDFKGFEVDLLTAVATALVFARRNDDLRLAVNVVLREMIRAGEMERLRDRWLKP